MILQQKNGARLSSHRGPISGVFLALALALAGCGGGGGDGVCDAYACGEYGETDGIWQETNSGGIVIVSDYGTAVDAINVLPGHLRGNFEHLEGTTYFAYLGYFYPSGLLYNLTSNNAIVIPRTTIDVTYESAYTVPLTMHMVYDTVLSDRPSSLGLVSGIWSATEGEITTTITIDSSGAIFGSDSDGCVYTGKVVIPTTLLNAYLVYMDIENCVNYLSDGAGQGILMDTTTANDTLLFAATRRQLPTGISYIRRTLYRQ